MGFPIIICVISSVFLENKRRLLLFVLRFGLDIEMLGTALQFGGIKGEDRFYIPVRARKNYNQQKPSRRPNKTDETESPSSDIKTKVVASTTKPSKPLAPQPKSNLERFLDATRPSVPAQNFSKVNVRIKES